MKKTVAALSLILALILVLAGCGSSIEKQSQKLVEEKLAEIQSGNLSQEDLDSLMQGFSQNDVSDAAQKDIEDAFVNLLKKMTYKVTSSKADEKKENVYIVTADVKIVDGEALFLNTDILEGVFESLIENIDVENFDQEALQKEIVEVWAAKILEQSKAVKATKNASVDYEITYDKDTKGISGEVQYAELIGLRKDFEKAFEEEFTKSFADFGLEFYAEILNKALAAAGTDDYSAGCAANGKNLVITFTLSSKNSTKEFAEAVANQSASAYGELLNTLKASGISCDKLILEFKGADSKLLASREFTK